jgi:hypothetical protein
VSVFEGVNKAAEEATNTQQEIAVTLFALFPTEPSFSTPRDVALTPPPCVQLMAATFGVHSLHASS